MAGAKNAEVAAVEGSEFRFTEALDDGENGGVHEADVGISVAIAKIADATVVRWLKVFHLECAGDDVVEEGRQHACMQSCVHPVVYLYENGGGNHQCLLGLFDETAAGDMIGIATVQRGVEGAGV